MNITEIASKIRVNKSTISREINKYSYIKNGNEFSCLKEKLEEHVINVMLLHVVKKKNLFNLFY